MKLHSIFWDLFILVLITFLGLYFYIWFVSGHWLNLFSIETASVSTLRKTFNQWLAIRVEGSNLLHFAKVGTYIDFLWILGYAGVLTMVTYAVMQRQRNPSINNLLRFTLLLPLLAALFDVFENIILLYDMHSYTPYKKLISSMGPAWIKWTLIIFILLTWLLAGISSRVIRRKLYYFK